MKTGLRLRLRLLVHFSSPGGGEDSVGLRLRLYGGVLVSSIGRPEVVGDCGAVSVDVRRYAG
jgi:hypothetical protein